MAYACVEDVALELHTVVADAKSIAVDDAQRHIASLELGYRRSGK
jgi:hypothetical protein